MTNPINYRPLLLLPLIVIMTSCMADLKVDNLSHEPECPSTTEQITFKATVLNAGNKPAGPSELSFKVGGESNPPVYPVPELEPGDKHSVTRQLVLNVAQNYQNTVTVDVKNDVSESNESNNQAIQRYSVGCCVPPYSPTFWNDSGTVQYANNCYNYGNNKRTDTFAQPGRAAGAQYTKPITCSGVINAAAADGLTPLPPSGVCPSGKDKIAVVVAPCVAPYCTAPLYSGNDYHWYRRDSSGMWSHKPGGTRATNLDNSNNTISNPETADRCGTYCYSEFCGYFCSCSHTEQGQGRENIQ
jgi:hypothetical protein